MEQGKHIRMLQHQDRKNNNSVANIGRKKGYSVEQRVDYGYGIIDTVWKIPIHPSIPEIKCGFIETDDWQDNQYCIGVLEEALLRGMRSGMDRIYLVTESEEMARSLSGKIEILSSLGSYIRFDAICLGLSPKQKKPSILIPSQEMNPSDDEK
jgi:hypothetical protein